MSVQVSIGIPTYNRLDTLRGAIASALVDYPFSVEVIVSDDNSIPEVGAYVRELAKSDPRLRYLRNDTNLGMVENWNACLKAANGKWFKLLCDDDELVPGALAHEVALAESAPKIALVSGLSLELQASEFKKTNRVDGACTVGLRQPGLYTAQALYGQMIMAENCIGPPPAVLFRREFLPAFRPLFQYATDWAAWLELLEKGDLVATGQPSCFFRLHENNLTKYFVKTNQDFVEVFALRMVALEKSGGGLRGIALLAAFFYRMLRRLVRLALLREWAAMPRFIKSLRLIPAEAQEFISIHS